MKKIALAASLATLAFAVTAFVAPKTSEDDKFEGVITYSISIDNQQYAQMFAGSSVKVYVKGTKTKTVSNMTMMNRTEISDNSSDAKPIVLIDAGGNKYQVKNNDTAKSTTKDPDIKYVDGTKEIAGYTCKKAQVTVTSKTGETTTADVYYTEKIPAFEGKNGQFKGLKGCALEFSVAQQGINMTMTATEVKKQSVPDDAFTVPKGYKLMSMQEIMADMQKNMGGGDGGN